MIFFTDNRDVRALSEGNGLLLQLPHASCTGFVESSAADEAFIEPIAEHVVGIAPPQSSQRPRF